MEAKKRFRFFKWMRWLGLLFGGIMFFATAGSFGRIWATVLSIVAIIGFYHICDGESHRTMCQYVAEDLKATVNAAGLSRCVVEIRSISAGLIITRVYLIGAADLAARYNRAVMERINKSWYRKSIWATQILELADESELEEAHEFLEEALIDDLRRMRGEAWNSLESEERTRKLEKSKKMEKKDKKDKKDN